MDFNRTTIANYTTQHDAAMDAAGWTEDEKTNGRYDSFDFNRASGKWDILNTEYKTMKLFDYIQNPDESDDVVFIKQTDSLTVINQAAYDTLMADWFPEA